MEVMTAAEIKAATEPATSMKLNGDEARYALAYLRWRVGRRSSRPGPGHYLGDGWPYKRCSAVENAMDAMLVDIRLG